MLIKADDIKIGDLVSFSCYGDLKLCKVINIPNSKNTLFKLSYRRTPGDHPYENTYSCVEPDASKHDRIEYRRLHGRDVWLVKR